jgi:hypothetical protein
LWVLDLYSILRRFFLFLQDTQVFLGVTIGYYTVFSLPVPHHLAPSAYFIPLLVRVLLLQMGVGGFKEVQSWK